MKRKRMDVISNLLWICYVMVLSYFFLEVSERMGLEQSFSIYSQADIQMFFLVPWRAISILLLPVIFRTVQMLSEELSLQRLVRRGYWGVEKCVWKRILLFSMEWSVAMSFSGILWGLLHGKVWINWNDYASYFFMVTREIQTDRRFLEVLLIVVCLNLLRSLWMGQLLRCFWQIQKGVSIPLLVVFALIYSSMGRYPMLCYVLNWNNQTWLSPSLMVSQLLQWLFLEAIFIMLAFRFGHKQLIFKEQICKG